MAKTDFQSMRDLLEEKKKLEKKMNKVKIPCSHTNDKGKLKVDFLKGTLVKCKKCGAIFDFEIIGSDDLDSAIDTIHNAINQIKSLGNDPDSESGIIRELGGIDYNLSEVGELYKRVINKNSKDNNKKKKNRNDDFGSYGAGNINFIDNKRRKY